MATVTRDQIKHIAMLSRLRLDESELDRYVDEFNEILEYVSKLNDCDTTGVDWHHNLGDYKGTVLAEDELYDYEITREDFLKNASHNRNKLGYVRTSKIVSKE